MDGYVDHLARRARSELELITAGRKAHLSPDQWKPVAYVAWAPEAGVTLDGGPLLTCFERNIDYLNEWVEKTDDWQDPIEEDNWWVSVLTASSEGRMLGAASHALRWGEREDMRHIVDTLVGLVKERQRDDGYCLPYDDSFMAGAEDNRNDERKNYDRVNLTRGMVAAASVGNGDALPVIRKFYDWLYASPHCARLLAGPFENGSSHNCNNGHEGSLLMYFSSAGKPEDLVSAERYFVQDFFIEASRKREALSLSDYPFHVAHSYVFLAYKAWLDHYRATGAEKYIEGAKAAWDIVHDHFLHIGGSAAICEQQAGTYPPDSCYLHTDKEHHTGESCGSVFWSDINHRLLQFYPTEAKYADEIERSIFNVVLANQDERGYIRYHSRLEGEKEEAKSINTCCEVMGSPFIANLPQYVYSVADDGLYVNLFTSSSITWKKNDVAVTVNQRTDFPYKGTVEMEINLPDPTASQGRATPTHARWTLRVRIPGWAPGEVDVCVNGRQTARGTPGSYVELDRTWGDGDIVSLRLPAALRVERYAGADQHPKYDRYALLHGPVLMALTGADDLDIPAAELTGRLEPVGGQPLHFTVRGAPGSRYIPYWQIHQEPFTCFPTVRS